MMNPRACFFVALLAIAGLIALQDQASCQNSTRKIRTKPSATTAKIGLTVKWSGSFEKAMELAKKQNKPVLWYVSTLPNTFMDRKVEIDRYMLSGPFSWPAIVETINENAIATRAIPNPNLQKKFGLNPYEFVEPGIVILSPDGKVKFSMDKLSTLHPVWMLEVLKKQLGNSNRFKNLYHDQLADAWKAFSGADYAQALRLAQAEAKEPDAGLFIESLMLQGMCKFRQGNHEQAIEVWTKVADRFPNHPLGQKCSAEAQKIGPFYRGFEIHRELPQKAMAAGIDSAGSAAPKDSYSEKQLRQRSVEFLLGMQHSNGGFLDSDYDFGGTDSLPNVYVAVTSLAGMALLAESQQGIPENATYDQQRIKQAIQRSLKYVLNDKNINKVDRDEILWAYAYRLRFVARSKQVMPDGLNFQAELQKCIDSLQSVQSRRGNWYHEYGNPFVTATALLALNEAESEGGNVSKEVIEKGINSLSRDRFGNGAYPYGNANNEDKTKARGTVRNIAASAGRMPLCELALLSYQKSDQKNLVYAIEQSFKFHDKLNSAFKYDNHTSNLAYGGFFFWYDMRSRSEAIVGVLEKPIREKFQKQHKALIMALPELDGCFIDSHELGRVYGTAMALLSLSNVNQD